MPSHHRHHRHHVPALIAALALLVTAGWQPLHTRAGATTGATAGASTAGTSTAGTELPFTADDLVDPGRGQYRWGNLTKYGDADGEYFPNSQPQFYDSSTFWPGGSIAYYRTAWNVLEPSEGVFDFSTLDAKIAAAASRGERFGFRVMAVDSCCSNSAQIFPAWLTTRVNAWTFDNGQGDRAVIPDWNDADYLSAMKGLIAALGQRYDRDDRVAFVDMLGYGNFGEWHTSPWEGVTGPQGQTEITDANARSLVQANLDAFPSTTVLSLTPQDAALSYAMSARSNVGLRVDCLGDASGGYAWPRLLANSAALNRWRTAPVVTEWCNSNYTTADQLADPDYAFLRNDVGRDLYAVGRGQVAHWHISLLSSGNFPAAYEDTAMTSTQFTDWSLANKTAGYRYSVRLASAPASVRAGSSVTLSTTWKNSGTAPTYESWTPTLALRPHGSSATVASHASSVVLRMLVADSTPDGSSTPTPASSTVSDSVPVPSGTAPGTYDIVASVPNHVQKAGATTTMPSAYYGPVPLAQDGRTTDGGYVIGTITVTA